MSIVLPLLLEYIGRFELTTPEEEPLVSKILMLSGVVTKQQDIGQVGANAIQMTNQEQNS